MFGGLVSLTMRAGMARREAPDALERLDLERILTVKRMVDAYGADDLSR